MNPIALNFKKQATASVADENRRRLVLNALGKFEMKRDEKVAQFQNWQEGRNLAASLKWEALENLAQNIELLAKNLQKNGAKVHWAATAEEARNIIAGIAKEKNAKLIVKSKAMTAEEIHLNDALEKQGFEVIETDLGEFIVQLRKEPPYHIVFPAMHLTRYEISDLFAEKLQSQPTDKAEELTMIARKVLRDKYVRADIGITGGNFAVAELGAISITENEGNARLTAALPRVMITLIGIEKIIPRLEDLALFLPMLATAGAAQTISGYNTLYSGPRKSDEADGPEEYHVVLLDNGRTELLADPVERDALRCIRCGACLNVCPIYRTIGGHAYGTTYCGPIGAVITPPMRGIKDWQHLSYASSLCGACSEICPVKINLHHHLLKNRKIAANKTPVWWQKIGFKALAKIANCPTLWSIITKLGRIGQKLHPLVKGTKLDPAYAWTNKRDLPPIAKQTFKEWWRTQK
ncbi:MAG: LutB/LldF family L-lactate oxidation iron-sulfur protein [Verrucomicrobiae bacterium]|nr:LutB/LldF family L-lactate oxidation iron-sulfur protein [Verrucomicrobiae bacterium]